MEPGLFSFSSVLAEGAITLGRIRPYYRLERTERPEEERKSGFRSPRPPHDDALLGKKGGGLFTVGDWYRRSTFWELRIGLRMEFGMEGHRMRRYGLMRAAVHPGGHPR